MLAAGFVDSRSSGRIMLCCGVDNRRSWVQIPSVHSYPIGKYVTN
jgi:hypothetical protein